MSASSTSLDKGQAHDAEKQSVQFQSRLEMGNEKERDEKRTDDVTVTAVLVQDAESPVSAIDRFARLVTAWISKHGLEGHGCVTIQIQTSFVHCILS